jgi:hypothetical protein
MLNMLSNHYMLTSGPKRQMPHAEHASKPLRGDQIYFPRHNPAKEPVPMTRIGGNQGVTILMLEILHLPMILIF